MTGTIIAIFFLGGIAILLISSIVSTIKEIKSSEKCKEEEEETTKPRVIRKRAHHINSSYTNVPQPNAEKTSESTAHPQEPVKEKKPTNKTNIILGIVSIALAVLASAFCRTYDNLMLIYTAAITISIIGARRGSTFCTVTAILGLFSIMGQILELLYEIA